MLITAIVMTVNVASYNSSRGDTSLGATTSDIDCTVNVDANTNCGRGLGALPNSPTGISSLVTNFVRTVGNSSSTVGVAPRTTRTCIRACFVRTSTESTGGAGRRNRGFLTRGGAGGSIVAARDNLRCRMIARNGNTGPATSSGIGIRCANALLSKAGFSDAVSHNNRPTRFPINNMVGN